MENDDQTLLELTRRIALDPDVKRVLKLERLGSRFHYLVETNFFAWPRYIIGSANDNASDVRRNFMFGLEDDAMAKWEQLQDEHQSD